MDNNHENLDQVVEQYGQDLLDLGVLQSKADLCTYFSRHGMPGAQLQIVHKFISNYFKTKLGTVSDDTLDKEAQTLMRLFPDYNRQHARFLLYYFGAEENRVEIVMRMMLLHSNDQLKSGDVDTSIPQVDFSNTVQDTHLYQEIEKYNDLNQPGPSNIIKLKTSSTPVSLSLPLPQQQRIIHPKFADKYFLQWPQQTQQQRLKVGREIPSATIVKPTVEDDVNPGHQKAMIPERAEASSRSRVIVQPARFEVPVYLPNTPSTSAAATVTSSGSHQKQTLNLKQNQNVISTAMQPMNLIVQPKTEVHLHAEGGSPTNNIYLQQVVYKNETKVHNKEQQKQQRNRDREASFVDDDMDRAREVGVGRRVSFEDLLDEHPLPKYMRLGDANDLVVLNDSDSDLSHEDEGATLSADWLSPSDDSDPDENWFAQASGQSKEQPIEKDGLNGDKASSSTSYNVKLVSHILEMFPDACPNYVKKLCNSKSMTDENVGTVIQMIFSVPEYPKRQAREPSPEPELDFETQVQILKDILPDADPTYLESQAQIYLGDNEAVKEFIANAVELRNYPTMKEYLRRQQLNSQVKQYTTEFDVEKFLEIIPDPETHFREAEKRFLQDPVERHLCFQVLKNLYSHLLVRHITAVFNARRNLIIAANELDQIETNPKNIMKSKRKKVPVDLSALQNIPLLQEIAYLNHRALILNTIKEKKLAEIREREEAKANNLMTTCNCCFDDEVMLKDVFKCENECSPFCRSCVQKSVEVMFGEGKLNFPCFKECTPNAVFSLKTLKAALNPKLFSKVAQKKQLDEVKAAGIEDLVMCPFCDFATIPPPGDKIFKCLNPECMKESCRECKEPSHVPLRCDEIEKDADVQKRTYIENKMTEALVRTCYKCGTKFIKEDGCNKMTCSRCGAQMCYICLKPVTDYKHFNGQGGDKHHLCPLYSDTNKMHVEQVMKGAQKAKDELGINNEELKIDPTADLQKHYKSKQGGAAARMGLQRYLLELPNIQPEVAALERLINQQRQNFEPNRMVVNYAFNPGVNNVRPGNPNRPGTPPAPEPYHHHHHHHHRHRHQQNQNYTPDRRFL